MVKAADILNAKILVVDDREANVLLLKRALTGEGYVSVETTTNPHEVCDLHLKNHYDLILLDLEMPGMDGFQVVEGLKKIEERSFLPVLVITVEPDHKMRALQAGVKDFVNAPIDLVEVLARARNMIEARLLHSRIHEHSTNLENINKELESFTHSVSHDLRTPLRLTNKVAHLLLKEHGAQLPPGAVDKIHMILDSTEEMGRLIADLLAFSQANRGEVKRRRVDMRRLVREVLAELQDERQDRDVEVIIDDMPPCDVDRALMKQVYMNLLANALKFTRPQAHARIRVGCAQSNGENVYFVRDNGVGFDMAQAKGLFVAFHRLYHAYRFEGTGVGLALVKRIIDRHDGRIWAESSPDQGATFYLTLGT